MTKQDSSNSRMEYRRGHAKKLGDQDYLKRRKELLEAAGRVFREKGFERTSVKDFTEAVGIDRATFYYYSSGKKELFREIVQNAIEACVSMAQDVERSSAPPEQKLVNFIHGLMQAYETHFPFLHVYIQENLSNLDAQEAPWTDEIRRLSQKFDQTVEAIVQEGVDAGVLDTRGTPTQIIAYAIIGMCNWSHRWFPSDALTAETVGRYFSDFVLNGLLQRKS